VTGISVRLKAFALGAAALAGAVSLVSVADAQVAPSEAEGRAYEGLHAAAWNNDLAAIGPLLAAGADPNARDSAGRTPLHVAAFQSHDEAVAALVAGGSDPNALENGVYDIITIAAVADDPELVRLAIELGGNPGNITSIYDGTALIAAAHLGHVEVVKVLIEAGAPLDHINNLGWTALIEAVVLGDGGPDHVATARALVEGGADKNIPDRGGQTPFELAEARGYAAMMDLLR